MSLRIVHTFGRNAGAVQAVDKAVVRFGRAPDNDVAFDPDYDRDAGSHHAEARLEGGGWVLVDLESKNGTFVRGQRVKRHALAPGDEVTFGAKGPRVRFEMLGAAPAAQGAQAAPVSVPLLAGAAAPSPSLTVAGAPLDVSTAEVRAPAKAAPAAAPPARPPQPAGAPVLLAPAAGKRVGQRTMAAMVSSAVAAATGRSRPRATREIDAYVDGRVGAAVAGQRRTTRTLGVLLVLALATLGGLIFWSTRSQDDISKLRTQLARLPPDDPKRKEIEGRLGTLHPSNATFGRNLYDQSKKGIFMLAAGGNGFCTAFAVRANVLATNAHCVFAARRAGGAITAVENEGHGQVTYAVSDMKPHPGYRDNDASNITPDVGVVTISGKVTVVLTLAGQAELAAAGAGDDIYLIGFPGRLMDPSNPSATFLAAHVGRTTNALGRPGAYADAWLVQHDAATTHGTSGSPVFNGKGNVIAINAGGYTEADDETVAGRKTEVVKDSPYKFAMRIDLLDAVLR